MSVKGGSNVSLFGNYIRGHGAALLWNQSIHKCCNLSLNRNIIGYDRPDAFISQSTEIYYLTHFKLTKLVSFISIVYSTIQSTNKSIRSVIPNDISIHTDRQTHTHTHTHTHIHTHSHTHTHTHIHTHSHTHTHTHQKCSSYE